MKDSPFDIKAILEPYLSADEVIAVGVSGGPDSMALCHMLANFAGINLHVLSVDHGLRKEAAGEAKNVGSWCSRFPNVKHQVLTRESSESDKTRLQENARIDRYKMMAEYCATHNIKKLFLAHHLDDQAETFLFRLAKGSGLDGLSCMAKTYNYSEELVLVRPLLDIAKSELLSYCEKENISYIHDPSNQDERFARARLRGSYDILEAEGLSTKRLSVTAKRLARARAALDFYSDQLFEKSVVDNEAERIVFDADILSAAPFESVLRVMLKSIELLHPDQQGYGPRMEKLEGLTRNILENSEFKKSSLGGCLFDHDFKQRRITIEIEHKKTT